MLQNHVALCEPVTIKGMQKQIKAYTNPQSALDEYQSFSWIYQLTNIELILSGKFFHAVTILWEKNFLTFSLTWRLHNFKLAQW